jgi:hypothetical protein
MFGNPIYPRKRVPAVISRDTGIHLKRTEAFTEKPCTPEYHKRETNFKLRAVHRSGTGRNRQKIAREIALIGPPLRSKRYGHQSGILGIGAPFPAINFDILDISRDEATSPASQKEQCRGNPQILELSRIL